MLARATSAGVSIRQPCSAACGEVARNSSTTASSSAERTTCSDPLSTCQTPVRLAVSSQTSRLRSARS
ncbi:hypothetical protein ACFQXA_04735 [Nocardiopsis composta]